jgi:hypothetical protein
MGLEVMPRQVHVSQVKMTEATTVQQILRILIIESQGRSEVLSGLAPLLQGLVGDAPVVERSSILTQEYGMSQIINSCMYLPCLKC